MIKAASALSFLLEVALIGSVVMWATAVWELPLLVAIAGAGIPAAVLTAIFLTSTSSWRLLWPVRPVVAHGLFITGAIVLIGLEHLTFGWIFMALALASIALTWTLRATLRVADHELRSRRAAGGSGSGARARRRPAGRRATR